MEHQIFSFGKMILRDRCSASYDLAALFRGRRSTLDSIGARPSIAVSQNCCLAELLRFWRCQVQKLRKSRGIAAFLMLSSSTIEEASQNSFADRQIDRQLQLQLQVPLHYTTTTTTSTNIPRYITQH